MHVQAQFVDHASGRPSGGMKIARRSLWITCCAFVDPLPGPPRALPLGSDVGSVETERERGDIASRGEMRGRRGRRKMRGP